MSENSQSGAYKVLLWSDAHKNRPYQRYIGPEVKGTSFGNRNAHGFHEIIRRGDVDAVWHVGDTYSIYSEDYEDGKLVYNGASDGIYDEREDHLHTHRHNPEKDLEYMLSLNPQVQHYFAPGNHDGYRLENKNHPFIRFLEKTQHKYPNLHVEDQFIMGNMLALHGHQYIDTVRHRTDPETGLPKDLHYVVGTPRRNFKVPIRDHQAMAKAICQQRGVQDFIYKKADSAPQGCKSEVYIIFGHTHRGFEATVSVDDKIDAHVINLGALVPGKIPNFKIVHFKEGVVDRIEPVNFKVYSASLDR